MGGAERDLIRVLPSINRLFEVTMATIQPSLELEETCSDHGIELIRPDSKWVLQTDPLSVVMDSGRGTASKAWGRCPGLKEAIESAIAIHMVSGDGSLPLLDHVPPETRVHLHLLEPPRGSTRAAGSCRPRKSRRRTDRARPTRRRRARARRPPIQVRWRAARRRRRRPRCAATTALVAGPRRGPARRSCSLPRTRRSNTSRAPSLPVVCGRTVPLPRRCLCTNQRV